MPRLLKLVAVGGVGLLAALAAVRADKPADQLPHVEAKTHQNYTETVEDKEAGEKVTIDMVAIPGGTYLMGSPPDEKGHGPDEGPRHPVRVQPFWMAKCECSWEEFDMFQTEMEVGSPKENDD